MIDSEAWSVSCSVALRTKLQQNGVRGIAIRDRIRGLNMTDQKLHSLSENQLRALYNSAPDYLKSLLARKRTLEEGIVWEMSIPQRAASRPS